MRAMLCDKDCVEGEYSGVSSLILQDGANVRVSAVAIFHT